MHEQCPRLSPMKKDKAAGAAKGKVKKSAEKPEKAGKKKKGSKDDPKPAKVKKDDERFPDEADPRCALASWQSSCEPNLSKFSKHFIDFCIQHFYSFFTFSRSPDFGIY